MVKQVINNIVKTKYLSRSLIMHATFILSISLSSISKHLDLKNEKAKKELLNNYKTINTSIVFENDKQQEEQEIISQSQLDSSAKLIKKIESKPSTKTEEKTQNNSNQNKKLETKIIEKKQIQEVRQTTDVDSTQNTIQIQTTDEKNHTAEKNQTPQPTQEEQEIAQMSQQLAQYDSTKINNKASMNAQINTNQEVNKIAILEQQIQTCWSRYSAGKSHNNTAIKIQVKYDKDGNIQSITPLQNATDISSQNMQENAIKAIKDCNPINTQQIYDIYDQWQEVVFNFQYK
jgi:hypothetical protein